MEKGRKGKKNKEHIGGGKTKGLKGGKRRMKNS